MSSVPRRVLGVVVLGIAGLCLVQPPLLRSATGGRRPTLAEPASLVSLAEPAFVAAGTVLLLAGVAALRGRRLAPRGALVAPAMAAILAVPLAAPPDTLVADPGVVLAAPTGFVVAGAVVGASLAPVVLGAIGDDTLTLLVGTTVLLAAVFAAPFSAFALVGGLAGGGAAVGVLWVLDPETWRP